MFSLEYPSFLPSPDTYPSTGGEPRRVLIGSCLVDSDVLESYFGPVATLYELRASYGMELKKDLLIQVAQLSGDGLRTTCLKMPTN